MRPPSYGLQTVVALHDVASLEPVWPATCRPQLNGRSPMPSGRTPALSRPSSYARPPWVEEMRHTTANDYQEVGRISPVPRTPSPPIFEASTRTTNMAVCRFTLRKCTYGRGSFSPTTSGTVECPVTVPSELSCRLIRVLASAVVVQDRVGPVLWR